MKYVPRNTHALHSTCYSRRHSRMPVLECLPLNVSIGGFNRAVIPECFNRESSGIACIGPGFPLHVYAGTSFAGT